jgi:hypothetical protein
LINSQFRTFFTFLFTEPSVEETNSKIIYPKNIVPINNLAAKSEIPRKEKSNIRDLDDLFDDASYCDKTIKTMSSKKSVNLVKSTSPIENVNSDVIASLVSVSSTKKSIEIEKESIKLVRTHNNKSNNEKRNKSKLDLSDDCNICSSDDLVVDSLSNLADSKESRLITKPEVSNESKDSDKSPICRKKIAITGFDAVNGERATILEMLKSIQSNLDHCMRPEWNKKFGSLDDCDVENIFEIDETSGDNGKDDADIVIACSANIR